MSLYESFRDGGFPMFFVLGFGVVLMAISARYAYRPESRLVPLLVSTGALTLFSGCFGFVSGVIATTRAAAKLDDGRSVIAMIGFGESLNNLAWAFALISLATILTVVGAARLARKVGAQAQTA
jgi:hypothetical protein